MPTVVTAGELLVEFMRPELGVPLAAEGTFKGPFPSGAPCIFIDAVQRLGIESGIVGTVGDDAFGDVIQERLSDDGVDTSHVRVSPDRTTGTAFVTYFADDTREFLFHLAHAAAGQVDPENLEAAWLDDCEAIHVSGSAVTVNAAMARLCERLVALARDRGILVSFDPNIRSSLLESGDATEVIETVLSQADLVTPTQEELRSLVSTGETDAERAEHLLDRGADLVAVTHGGDGCTIYTAEGTVQHPGFPADVADPTGAGDAFAAGLVVATLEDMSIGERAAFANAVGSEAVAAFGPMAGLPERKTVDPLVSSE